jgi:glycosyltransferase involved in cell wall biosynthesis
METVAILCPGPSLANLTAEALGHPSLIIAVNFAMDHPLAKWCDYWCAHDLWAPPLKLPRQAPEIGMVTCRAAIAEGQADHVPYPLFDFRKSRFAEPVRISTSAAIYWAAEFLATDPHKKFGTIALHGCDMKGNYHFDGSHDPLWSDQEWDLAKACLRKAIDAVPFRVTGAPW